MRSPNLEPFLFMFSAPGKKLRVIDWARNKTARLVPRYQNQTSIKVIKYHDFSITVELEKNF